MKSLLYSVSGSSLLPLVYAALIKFFYEKCRSNSHSANPAKPCEHNGLRKRTSRFLLKSFFVIARFLLPVRTPVYRKERNGMQGKP